MMKELPLFQYEYWGNSWHLPAVIQMGLEDYFLKYVALANEKPLTRKAVVRFFSFPADTVVIGYGQDLDVLKKRDQSFAVVRRITGGAHIQLGTESLAYSIVVPRDGTFATFHEMREYYAEPIAKALRKLGVAPIETNNMANITVNGKILSGQGCFWGIKSALSQGMIFLYPYDVDKIAERVALLRRQIGGLFYSEYKALTKLPTVAKQLEGKLTRSILIPEVLREIVADAILQEITGGRFARRHITDEVVSSAADLVLAKYGTSRWIEKREPTFTKKEVEEIQSAELDGPLATGRGYCLFLGVSDEDFLKMTEPEPE